MITKRSVQRVITLFLVTVLCFNLTACGSKTDTSETQPAAVGDSEEAADEGTAADATTTNVEATTETVDEGAVQEETAMGETTLTYIGHASVKIVAADGTVIYIDPNYAAGDYADQADYIFVTHGHSDHTPCNKVKENEGCQVITFKEALHDGIYESYDFGNFQVQAVPASNSNHDIKKCVGYIITVDGITVYHAGDTSMIDQMKDLTALKLDYAMYPIDGTYNMDAAEATEVANLVGAKNNIPIHEFDTGNKKKSDNFIPEGRLVLEYGETITLSR